MRLTAALLFRRIPKDMEVPKPPTPDSWFRKQTYFRFSWKYYGRSRNCFTLTSRAVHKALEHAQYNRYVYKLYARSLWELRTQAALREYSNMPEKMFREGLSQCNVALDRRTLSLLSIYEPRTFECLVDVARSYHAEAAQESGEPTRYDRLLVKRNPTPVVTRGLLRYPIVPGNRHLYD